MCTHETRSFPRLVVAGTHSGAGKTSMTTALLAALTHEGVAVQPFKVGPDYIDPAFHTFVAGVPSRNLDSWLLAPDVLRTLFMRHAPEQEKGLALIEGVMGLFDGKGTTHEASTAHVAELLAAPVVLVVDAKGLSRSAAAMVAGYAAFHPGIRVAGVLCNRVKSERHYALIKESIEGHCGIPCLGRLPENSDFILHSRRLGLVPPAEVKGIADTVAALSAAAKAYIDLDGLLALAASAPHLPSASEAALPGPFAVRIGVARDEAFSFYYQDNLDLLEAMGAELVFFSPMRDAALPEGINGAYFGGGRPDVFSASLAANVSMRRSLRNAAHGGMPIFAEGGATAYFHAFLADDAGVVHPMAEVFPETAVMSGKLQRFGYAEATFAEDTILGRAGEVVRTNSFHYWRISPESNSGPLVMRKSGAALWQEGKQSANVFATWLQIHFYSNPQLAARFLARCAECSL